MAFDKTISKGSQHEDDGLVLLLLLLLLLLLPLANAEEHGDKLTRTEEHAERSTLNVIAMANEENEEDTRSSSRRRLVVMKEYSMWWFLCVCRVRVRVRVGGGRWFFLEQKNWI